MIPAASLLALQLGERSQYLRSSSSTFFSVRSCLHDACSTQIPELQRLKTVYQCDTFRLTLRGARETRAWYLAAIRACAASHRPPLLRGPGPGREDNHVEAGDAKHRQNRTDLGTTRKLGWLREPLFHLGHSWSRTLVWGCFGKDCMLPFKAAEG